LLEKINFGYSSLFLASNSEFTVHLHAGQMLQAILQTSNRLLFIVNKLHSDVSADEIQADEQID
jgi:hypothetical protein